MNTSKKHAKNTKGAKKKKPPGAFAKDMPTEPLSPGRPIQDSRGKTQNYSIHLVPAQMESLRRIAKKRRFKNVSRMIGSFADSKRNQ